MDVLTLLRQAWAAGLSLTADGERLTIRGPRQAEGLVRQLVERKPEVLRLIQQGTIDVTPSDLPPDWHFLWDERAAIMEHDGKMPRERAEAEALKDILRQMQAAGIALPSATNRPGG
jgi:hypothetical protein